VHLTVSAPNEQAAGKAGFPPGSAGLILADGRRIYRLVMPQTIWWTWVGVVVLGLGDLVIQGHNWISLKFSLGLLTATGVIYACTLWPRVIADTGGITVHNPFRSFHVPWGAVNGIFLADSVEVQCARPAPKSDKTVYSWALAAPRRARARAQLRGRQWDQGRRNRPSTYDHRMPAAAKDVVKLTQAEVMARELARMSEQARSRPAAGGTAAAGTANGLVGGGKTGGGKADSPADTSGTGNSGSASSVRSGAVLSARWAWQPLAAIFVPAVAFAVAQLLR